MWSKLVFGTTLESCISEGKEADDKENAEGEGAEKQKEDIKPELVVMQYDLLNRLYSAKYSEIASSGKLDRSSDG